MGLLLSMEQRPGRTALAWLQEGKKRRLESKGGGPTEELGAALLYSIVLAIKVADELRLCHLIARCLHGREPHRQK